MVPMFPVDGVTANEQMEVAKRTNYAPLRRRLLRDVFGVEPPAADWKVETWPDHPSIARKPANGPLCLIQSAVSSGSCPLT